MSELILLKDPKNPEEALWMAEENTKRINSAILQAHQNGGGTVIIPEGDYAIAPTSDDPDSCINVLSNVTLTGSDQGDSMSPVSKLSLYQGTPEFPIKCHHISGMVRTPYNEVTDNIKVCDIILNGGWRENINEKVPAYDSEHPLEIKVDGFFCGVAPDDPRACSNIKIDNIIIENCSGYGLDPHERTDNLEVTNSIFRGNGKDGCTLDGIGGISFIKNCLSYNNGRHGFNITTFSKHLILENCAAFDNLGAGFIFQRGGEFKHPWVFNNTMKDCISHGNTSGVIARLADYLNIIDSEITGSERNGILLEGASNVSISGSTISQNGQDDKATQIRIRPYVDNNGYHYLSQGINFADDNVIGFSDDQLIPAADYKPKEGKPYVRLALAHNGNLPDMIVEWKKVIQQDIVDITSKNIDSLSIARGESLPIAYYDATSQVVTPNTMLESTINIQTQSLRIDNSIHGLPTAGKVYPSMENTLNLLPEMQSIFCQVQNGEYLTPAACAGINKFAANSVMPR